jgi:hypothetical protein
MKKTLILDESIWRCGGVYTNPIDEVNGQEVEIDSVRGRGYTALRNKYGHECCLGQFTKQLKPDMKLTDFSDPRETGKIIPLLSKKVGNRVVNTKLSEAAIGINDNEKYPVETKVKKLKSLFKRRGIKIVFKPIKKK